MIQPLPRLSDPQGEARGCSATPDALPNPHLKIPEDRP